MNKIPIEHIPIPLETCLSLTDAKKDDSYFNRYWFDLPAEWNTSDNNEKVIGVRSIYILKCRRKLQYKLWIRKYPKVVFREECIKILPKGTDISKFDFDNPSQDIIRDTYVMMMNDGKGSSIQELEIPITCWLPIEKDLREIYRDLVEIGQFYADDYEVKNPDKPKFIIDEIIPSNRDIQMDGIYINNEFVEQIYTSKNTNPSELQYIDFRITDMNNDFMQVMNISDDRDDASSNYKEEVSSYQRSINLRNVYDRHTCKIFSSLASQSNMNYLGHTEVHFNPIKYFKLKSTDQKFWVEFYAGRNFKYPIKLPKGESFFIELQLMRSNKLLYI